MLWFMGKGLEEEQLASAHDLSISSTVARKTRVKEMIQSTASL